MNVQKKSVALFALAMLWWCGTVLNAQNSNFHIYICFGQSNMEGQGAIEPRDTLANSRFRVLQAVDCPELGRTKGNWYPAVPPLCQCTTGLSLVDAFGKTLVDHLPDSITVGVVHVAVGGCDIRLFDKDLYPHFDSTYAQSWFTSKVAAYGGNPFQHMVELARQAQREGVVKGILLHQGETNTGQTEWLTYVKKIYEDLLAELSVAEVPLLAGEMVSEEDNCCARMNAIVQQLPEVVPNAHVISAAGCPAQDQAHFNSEGYRILGRRYALKMLSLLENKAGTPSK